MERLGGRFFWACFIYFCGEFLMSITIKNKLRILRGWKMIVPGCEPISAFTSPTLAANWECNASAVDVDAALEAIPGATIEFTTNPREAWFVLPSGPPGPPSTCNNPCATLVQDWYQILRDIASTDALEEVTREPTLEEICQTLPLKGIF